MSFLIAAVLALIAGALYLQIGGAVLAPVCQYTSDICLNPQWLLYAAIAFVVMGLLFRINQI
jgi:hypothetical protein